MQDTAQAENWDSVRDDLSALHESWDAHATYFHITLQHDELNESQLLVLSEMQEISIQNIL